MTILRLLPAASAAVAAAATFAFPADAAADVYVVRPRPIVVAPPPPPGVYVAPAAPVTPVCTTRTVRVWVNGAYTYRAVRNCY